MEKNSLSSSLESLKLYPIETSVLNAALGSLWHTLCQSVANCLEKYKSAELQGSSDIAALNSEANQVNDLVQLAKRSIVKLTSKSDMVEVITKRSKIMEDILGIEKRLDAVRFQGQQGKSIKLTNVQNFTIHLDVLESIDLLLHLRQSVLLGRDANQQEYTGTMTALVEYLNTQRPNVPCQTPIWPVESLFAPALSEVSKLFHQRLADDSDEEGNAPSIGYGKAYRAIWQGHVVMAKKISVSAFHKGALGLKEAVACMEANSRYLQQSPFLLNMVGMSWDADCSSVYLISPLASQLSLYDAFTNPKLSAEHRIALTPPLKASIISDVAAGIKHLHAHGMVHGRLKDANILLFDGFRAKVTDFGAEMFLSNTSRATMQGTHGIRWLPPEVVQYEKRLADAQEADAEDALPSLELAISAFPCPVSPSTDAYALGVLAMVLMTEKSPFSNVLWDEGVKAQLLGNTVPHLPSTYKEKETMGFMNDSFVEPCLNIRAAARPSAEELLRIAEKSFVQILRRTEEVEFRQHSDTIISVQQEIDDLSKQIANHQILVQRGRDIIGKKEMEKRKITDSKVRRETDLEIEKARGKLNGFQDELNGLEEDKDGAESDLVELFALRDEARERMTRSNEDFLSTRHPVTQSYPNNDAMLANYFTTRELEIYAPQLASVRQGQSTDLGMARSFVWSASVLAKSPFAHNNDPINDLTSKQERDLQTAINQKSSPYSHLVQDLDLIFRVPINAKALRGTQSIYVQNTVRAAAPEAPAGPAPTAMAPAFTAFSLAQHTPSAYNDRTISVMSEVMPVRNMTGLQRYNDPDQLDSDDDEAADPSIVVTHAPNADAYNHYYDKGNTNTNASKVLKAIPSTAAWDLQLSEQLVDEDDGFPDADFDIIHVQYLAACRGDWAESVGLRRHVMGFTDEAVSDYLDKQITPLHLAAKLGNLHIFHELAVQGGLVPMSLDYEGSTPMHYACQRGHLSIVRYLAEDHGFGAEDPNSRGITPIQYALRGGYLDIVEYFMENAPRLTSPSYEDGVCGASLLHWACLSASLPLIYYLLFKQNISIQNIASVDGSTPLLWACFAGSKDVVKFLIEQGNAPYDPNPNDRNVKRVINSAGQTCLHMATLSGDADKTTYLMDTVGLKITDKDKDHKTPFDLAEGAAKQLLKERKDKGFVTGSIAEKNRAKGGALQQTNQQGGGEDAFGAVFC